MGDPTPIDPSLRKLPRSRMWVPLLGLAGWARLWVDRVRGKHTARVTLRATGRDIRLRLMTSDARVVLQVYRDEEIRPPVPVEAATILDAGANIGITAGYFLDHFPGARLVAVEPDPDNLDALRSNLSSDADRVIVVEAGLWDEPGPLRIANPESESWARQVETADGETEGVIEAVTIEGLLDHAGIEGFDIIKIDIEGAESRIFVDRFRRHFERAKMVFVEAHGDAIQAQIDEFLAGLGFTIARQHDMTVGYRAG